MDNIFDFIPPPPTAPPEELPRSKKRETLTQFAIRDAKITLQDAVETALRTLEMAMRVADWPTAVKASLGILDRAGLGPRSTIEIDDLQRDLSVLSREQLAARAEALASHIRATVH
jgi:hypothetical protein